MQVEKVGTSTDDVVCRYKGSTPPTVECPAPKGASSNDGSPKTVELTQAEFKATHPVEDVGRSLQLSWTRNDGVQGSDLLSTPVKAGSVVTVTFTATASNSDVSASCTTQIHVLYVRSADGKMQLEPHGAVKSRYTSEPLQLVVEGALGDVVFSLQGNSRLPLGLEAEMTIALRENEQGNEVGGGDGNVRLRLLGDPAVAGRHMFELEARDTVTGTTAQVGQAPFEVDIRECDDDLYNTCFEGHCDHRLDPRDGNFECMCKPGFLVNDETGYCTEPSVTPTITCPCDVQLVAGLMEQAVAAPDGLNADAFVVKDGGSTAPTFSRSDGKPSLSDPFTTPFAGGRSVRW